MGSEGVSERAAGGWRSSTAAWGGCCQLFLFSSSACRLPRGPRGAVLVSRDDLPRGTGLPTLRRTGLSSPAWSWWKEVPLCLLPWLVCFVCVWVGGKGDISCEFRGAGQCR